MAREMKVRLSSSANLELWGAARVRSIYPDIKGTDSAIFEPEAGYMIPPEIARAYCRYSMQLGASVYEGTSVKRLICRGNRFVGVKTTNGEIWGDRIVIALGAATPRFLDAHGIPHSLWAERIQADMRRTSGLPSSHIAWVDDVNDIYGRVHEDGRFLIGSPTGDRNFIDLPVSGSAEQSALIEKAGSRRFSWMEKSLREGCYTSFDCYSSDRRGVIKYIDDPCSLAVVTGFSGGAFKIAPEIARRAAKILMEV